jgi:sec-independent protein translocase protein TatC
MVMFAAGGALAYLTLGKGLQFLLSFTGDGITPLLTVNRYMSFLFAMVLVFGLAFEFPVLLVLLNRIGVLPSVKLRSWRRQAIFLVFAFAAIATPSQDPFTMIALAVPMCAFYEVAIVIARVHESRVARRRAASARNFWMHLDDDDASPIASIA